MGMKLEIVLAILIMLIFFFGLNFSIKNSITKENNFTKELEFKETTLIEVDKKILLGKSFTKYGVSDNKILMLKNLTYLAPKLEYIKADEAKLDGYILYLKGNIEIKEVNGYLYKTEEAIFNQKSKILNIYTPFYAKMKNNFIQGNRLLYNLKDKKLYGREIKTRFFTCTK